MVFTGDSSWTPEENTYYHFLIINLDGKKRIESIATQGRASTLEFVTEYIVQYSDDGELWKSVTDPNGDTEVLTIFLIVPFVGIFHFLVSLCFA